MRRWYEVWPDLLEKERQELEGLGFSLDEDQLAHGRVVFHGSTAWEGKDVRLAIAFPASYPTLRPEIFAPDLHLGRHQNPFRGNLCLLDRSTRAWDPGLTAKDLVEEQLPKLLAALKEGGEKLIEVEAPQGEPLSRFYPTTRETVVFIPDLMLQLPAEPRTGELGLAVGQSENIALLRACLSQVRGPRQGKKEGQELARLDGDLAKRFARTALWGTWARLDHFPETGSGMPQDLLDAARAVEGFVEPPKHSIKGGNLQVVGIVAPEEVQQNEFEDTWLFVVRVRQGGRSSLLTVRGDRLGVDDLVARIPSLARMQERTIALAGLGALGSPLALELAKALTGELRVLDDDSVEAGNTVRWPVGITAAGYEKTAVMAGLIPQNWPFTTIRPFEHHLGIVPPPGDTSHRDEAEVVSEFLDGADLLVDATAEVGIQQFLGAESGLLDLPHVFVWMTEGGLGGVVARVVPGETGCWYCLQWHFEDGTIPLPPLEETATIQPRGCAAPTYIGSSFDTLPMVAQAMRVISETTLQGREGTNPKDVFVCDQATPADDSTIAPTWSAYPLTTHEECPYCGDAETE